MKYSDKYASAAHFVFSPFFEMGREESSSPFLTARARCWSQNLALKLSIASALLLGVSYGISFHSEMVPLSHMLLILVYFSVGIPSAIEAVESIVRLDIDIDVLMTIAAFSAFLIGSPFEGALLLVLFSLSGAIEESVTLKAKQSISQLSKINPTKAQLILPNGEFIERALEDVLVHSLILVRAGEIVPLDGVIISGASLIDLSHITGEHVPVRKSIGDDIPSGSRLIDGSIHLKVIRSSSESTFSKILKMISEAQEARPVIQRWFDRFSRNYAMIIICISAAVAIWSPYCFSISYLGKEGSIYRAVAFLIAASPCALILAVPIAYLSALGSAARKGIILKGGMVWDALEAAKIVALDKTGTLTLGKLDYVSLDTLYNPKQWTQEQILAIAQAVEKNVTHPIAKSICALDSSLRYSSANIQLVPGSGVRAQVFVEDEQLNVFIGDPESYVIPKGLNLKEGLFEAVQASRSMGCITSLLSIDEAIFLFRFKDQPRQGVKEMLQALKNGGRTVVMLTGDNKQSAEDIAKKVGVEEVYANLKPEDKLRFVEQFSAQGGLAMVGDGINDAPALARATVGISMGKIGSSTAAVASHVILLRDNIEQLQWLFSKAALTRAIVKQNVALAALAILCASVPALMGHVPLWLAVIVHEGGTVVVGLNALRLLNE